MTLGNRPSALDISASCPASARLSTGSYSRAALMSSYFHALLAFGTPKDGAPPTEEQRAAGTMRATLTSEELVEIEEWKGPEYVVVDGYGLEYEDAYREVKLALGDDLRTSVPFDGPGSRCQGTADMIWVFPERSIVFVGDLKKCEWTCPEGPLSLQLAFYGHAACAKYGTARYVPGLWFLESGRWKWGKAVAPWSFEEWELLDRLEHAINNTEGPAVTGSHCSACYNRLKCSEYLLPEALNQTRFAEMAEGGPGWTSESASRTLLEAQRAIKVAELAISNVKEWSRRGGVVTDGKMQYRPSWTNGRKSFDSKAALEADPSLAEKYTKQGKPFSTFRWTKEKE